MKQIGTNGKYAELMRILNE